MKQIRLGLALLITCVAAPAQPAPQPAGHWQGKIQIPDHELGVTVDLARNSKGAWIGSMTITASTSIDVPLSTITVDGASVRFAASLPRPASFDGRISEDGNSLSGKASNADGEAPFQLTRNGEPKVAVPPPSSALSK